jgi:hypothetical protein
MASRAELAGKLTAARTTRGWTIYQACKRMKGVSPPTLRNLEGREKSRRTLGYDVKLRTAVEICTVLWPDVQLEDFYEDQPLYMQLTPAGNKGRRGVKNRQKNIVWG